jgi:hypothetical protein
MRLVQTTSQQHLQIQQSHIPISPPKITSAHTARKPNKLPKKPRETNGLATATKAIMLTAEMVIKMVMREREEAGVLMAVGLEVVVVVMMGTTGVEETKIGMNGLLEAERKLKRRIRSNKLPRKKRWSGSVKRRKKLLRRRRQRRLRMRRLRPGLRTLMMSGART